MREIFHRNSSEIELGRQNNVQHVEISPRLWASKCDDEKLG